METEKKKLGYLRTHTDRQTCVVIPSPSSLLTLSKTESSNTQSSSRFKGHPVCLTLFPKFSQTVTFIQLGQGRAQNHWERKTVKVRDTKTTQDDPPPPPIPPSNTDLSEGLNLPNYSLITSSLVFISLSP